MFDDGGEDLVDREVGAVDDDGAVRDLEGGRLARAVDAVAVEERGLDGRLVLRGDAFLDLLQVAAAGTGLGGGVEVEARRGIGEDDGADVASFDGEVAKRAHAAQPVRHHGSDFGHLRDGAHVGVDLGRADGVARFGAVDEAGDPAVARNEIDLHLAGEGSDGLLVVAVDALAEGDERHDAVERARVDMEEAELLAQETRDG